MREVSEQYVEKLCQNTDQETEKDNPGTASWLITHGFNNCHIHTHVGTHTQRLILTHCCDFDCASQLFSQKTRHDNIIIYHEKYHCEQG